LEGQILDTAFSSVPEITDPAFLKTSPKCSFSVIEIERFGLVFMKTGSINSGTGVERCKSKTFSILSILGFALRSTLPFHRHFIIHPVLFILCLINVKRVTSLIIPVAFIAVHILNC
jgi:hypothetical protein